MAFGRYGAGGGGSNVNTDPVVIGTGTTAATGAGAVAIGKNVVLGASGSVGIGNGVTSAGSGVAIGATTTTVSNSGIAINGGNAGGPSSIAIGLGSAASSNDAVAMGTGASSAFKGVAIGNAANATGNSAVAIGQNAVANNGSGVAIGMNASATGQNAVALGVGTSQSLQSLAGPGATANAADAVTFGLQANGSSRPSALGLGSGLLSSGGNGQTFIVNAVGDTTNATPTELRTAIARGTFFATNIAASRTLVFDIKIAAHRTDVSGTAAAWPTIKAALTRDATGNCRLLGAVTGAGAATVADAGGATWSVSVTADTVNNRLAIAVTGEAGKTIRWTASISMAELA
jgi:trimeric autotransporter adhesin